MSCTFSIALVHLSLTPYPSTALYIGWFTKNVKQLFLWCGVKLEMMKQTVGSVGSLLAGACCLGFAPFLAGLSAIGAGFLVNDLFLVPLFAVFVGVALWGLWMSRARHGRAGPFMLGAIAAVTAFAALWFSAPLAYAGLAALVAASVWDIVLLRPRATAH